MYKNYSRYGILSIETAQAARPSFIASQTRSALAQLRRSAVLCDGAARGAFASVDCAGAGIELKM